MKKKIFLVSGLIVFAGLASAFSFKFSLLNLGAYIKNYGLYKAYADGGYGKSCNDYKNPTGKYKYLGDVGDGIYRVRPDAQAPIDVYCDMTTNGGGWTLATNAATLTTAYSTARDASVTSGVINTSTNWNIMGGASFDGIYGTSWLTTDKMVKIKDLATSTITTVPGTFINIGTRAWRNDTTNLLNSATGLNYKPVLYLDGSYGDWGGYGYSQIWIGNPNVGRTTWCDSTTDLYVYMNGDAGHAGVSSWQGGCNSTKYWKTNLTWQIYTK